MIDANVVETLGSNQFDLVDIKTIFEVLRELDDRYFNDTGEIYLTDGQYDALRMYAERIEPHNVYFTGIGSEVRGGKIKLPYPMGSLDQVQIGDIEGWIEKWGLQHFEVVITDKLDGMSGMLIYDDDRSLQIAYSRGDGVEGADITRHVRLIPSVPKKTGPGEVVRGEFIISIQSFEYLKDKIMSRSGKPYKNPRNMMSGIMNAKTNDPMVYRYIEFIAYDIVNRPRETQNDILLDLSEVGFQTPVDSVLFGKRISDEVLSKYLTDRREESPYEIDGLVLDVNDGQKRKRMNPTRDTLNPSFSVKYKVNDESNIQDVKVVDVELNLSKHGYLKPRVRIEPTEIGGVTVEHATGFNAKFIVDNMIGPGAIVKLTRSGDVIPFILSMVKPMEPGFAKFWGEKVTAFGQFDWTVNDQGEMVDIFLVNHEENRDVQLKQIVAFFTSIDAPLLKMGNVKKLYDAGYNTIESIIRADEETMVRVLGKNGSVVFKGLEAILSDIQPWKLMGSLPFFGRGIGKRKIKKLFDSLPRTEIYYGNAETYAGVEGFDEKTAALVEEGMTKYLLWLGELEEENYITISESAESAGSDAMSGEKVVFTGFRDKELHEKVEQAGGTMSSSVSGKTTLVVVKDVNSNSGKIKKARDLGLRIVSREELEEMLK